MKKHFTLSLLAMILSFAGFAQIKGISKPLCSGSTVYVSDSMMGPGGTWSSSNTAVATVSPAPPYGCFIGGVSSGVAVISYTLGTSTDIVSVTVTPTPAAISGTTHMCVSSSVTFSCATPGGIWTSSSAWVATIGSTSGIATGMMAGTTWISYTVGGCSSTLIDTVQSTYIDTFIKGPSIVCLSSTITLSDMAPGGTWTSSNPAVATVGSSSGVVTGVTSGTAIITYSVTGICGLAYTTKSVTVGTTTSPGTISGTSSIMATTTTTLTETVSGGTWSSGNPSVATISSGGVVTGVSAGTAVISYAVSGCSGIAYATFTITVTTFDGISGDVVFGGSPYYGPVRVWLITFDPSTNDLEALDSAVVYCMGSSVHYQFVGIRTDSFRVKAALDTGGIGSYIPTYHTSSYYWYSANVIPHVSGTSDINKDINMIAGTPGSGPGFIGGNVLSGANRGTSGGTPVVGLQVYLVNSTGSIAGQTKTDATGSYSFSGLAYGTYQVFPEALNYKTTAYSGITLSASNSSVTNAVFTKHTVSHTITPGALSVGTMENTSNLNIFPNPATGLVNIYLGNQTGSANISVKDIMGRELIKTTVSLANGLGNIDLSSLANGQYFINVTSGDTNINTKVQIQH